jgi:class 3 adenylate cyclase
MLKNKPKAVQYLAYSTIAALSCALVVLIFSFVMNFFLNGMLESMNQRWVDNLFVFRKNNYSYLSQNKPDKEKISVVMFDGPSDTKLQKFWPYDRAETAKVVDFLRYARAKALLFDILFYVKKPEKPQSDQKLIESIKAFGNVYLGSKFSTGKPDSTSTDYLNRFKLNLKFEDKNLSKNDFQFSGDSNNAVFMAPFPELSALAKNTGFFNSNQDSDNSKRTNKMIFCVKDTCYPSLGLSYILTTRNAKEITIKNKKLMDIGGLQVPLNDRSKIIINWLGGIDDYVKENNKIKKLEEEKSKYSTEQYKKLKEQFEKNKDKENMFIYDQVSAWQLIKGMDYMTDMAKSKGITLEKAFETTEVIPELGNLKMNYINNKIIFIGVSTTGAEDNISTPFGTIQGVYNHAYLVDSLLRNNFIKPVDITVDLAILLMVCLISSITVFFAASKDSPLYAILPFIYIGVLTYFSIDLFGKHNILINYVNPFIGIVLSSFSGFSTYFVLEGKNKKQIKNAMSNYLSPQVIKAVTDNPEQLSSQRKPITVLFSDIRGFTTFSENNPAELVVKMLNEYLFDMTNIVFTHEGTLDKFIGDAVMAFWGAPLDVPDHALKAVKAALRMKEKVDEFNAEWVRVYKHKMNIGIGINTEEVVVGNIGSVKFMNYTVIGDGVNLAARLESLNKTYSCNIIISENTYKYVKDYVEVHYLDTVTVKGKSQETAIYELIGLKDTVKKETKGVYYEENIYD